MKALLICPADRPNVAHLAERVPLVAAPLLGRSAIEYWIEELIGRGAKHLLIAASDRPNYLRSLLGDGTRWGVQIEILPTPRELTPEEAHARYRAADTTEWLADGLFVIDHLPGAAEFPLFESYAGWFEALTQWMPRAVATHRLGVRQVQPGIWVGLRAEIAASAKLTAPCWIGDDVRVGPDAQIGPAAVLEDRVVVAEAASVAHSAVDPDTYVGELVSVQRSLALGSLLVSWETNSSVEVPDAFLLSPLAPGAHRRDHTSGMGRLAAAAVMIATSPFAVAVVLWSLLRGESPWQLRLALRPQAPGRPFAFHDTFAYYELTGARNWLRRWPQLWSVMRGNLCWFGNRPLRPTQAMALTNEFERLWLAAPVGLISLADAHGCADGMSDETCAHACFYAVHVSRKLNWWVLSRATLRAAMAWPIWGHRRKEATVPLQQLVPKQEL